MANCPSCATNTATNGFLAFLIPAACLVKMALIASSNGVPFTGSRPSVNKNAVNAPEIFASCVIASSAWFNDKSFLFKRWPSRNR